LKRMEVLFSPDAETRLQQVASANGKDAEQLVKDTVALMLENQVCFIEGIRRGVDRTRLTGSTGRSIRETDSVDNRSVRANLQPCC
jgi:hypothetical protein